MVYEKVIFPDHKSRELTARHHECRAQVAKFKEPVRVVRVDSGLLKSLRNLSPTLALQVPPEKEEQFWHLVEYFGLMEAFQEAWEGGSGIG